MLWKDDQLPRVIEETKPTLRGKCESVFSGRQTDSVPKETHVVYREVLYKGVRLMSVVLARQNSRTDHMRRPCTKNDAPAKHRGIWRKTFTSSRIRTKLRSKFLVKQR